MTGAAVTWAPNALLLLLEAPGALVWVASSAGVVTVVKPVVDSKVVEDSVTVVLRGEAETRSVEKEVLSVVKVLIALPSEEMVEVTVAVFTGVEMAVGVPLDSVAEESALEAALDSVAVGVGGGAVSLPAFRAAEAPWQ